MTFLNPWMLFGGLAAGIPIALHFFYRAHYKPQPWAAMKFLRLALEQTSRRLRFQELLLLILRVAVCALLAFALCRPASRSMTAGGGRGESVDAVIIIDTSYSMSAAEGDKTRLDNAKEAALKIIDNLPGNSTAQIVSCSTVATHLGPQSPTNLDQARTLIKNLKTSSLATDFDDAFAEALRAFKSVSGASKELYLISDMQALGWERQPTAIRSKCEEIKGQATIYLVRCTETKVRNVAVVGILPQSKIAQVDNVAFTVLLRNTGTAPVDNLDVTLTIDGQQNFNKDSVAVSRVEPGETKAVTITANFDKPGWQLLTARINDISDDKAKKEAGNSPAVRRDRANQDAIDEDNAFSMLIFVHESTRVLIVDGAPNDSDPKQAASYYFAHGLLAEEEIRKRIADEKKHAYHVTVTVVPPEGASADLLADYNLCVLADVAANQLPRDFVDALPGFVQGGKGLFIGSGPNVVAADYNARFGALLPAPLTDAPPFEASRDQFLVPDLATVDPYSFLGKLIEKGGALEDFAKGGLTGALTPVVDPITAGDKADLGRALMRFDNGMPLLLSKSVGAGEVMMLTTSGDRSWSVMCQPGTFAIFLDACMAEMIHRSSATFNRTAGEALRWSPPDAQKEYYVVYPDGERKFLGKPKEIGKEFRLPAFDSSKAGVYRIEAAGAREGEGDRFVFNPDLTESENLEALTDEQIDKQLGFEPLHLKTGFDGTAFTGTERSRNEWTRWALVALLVFALGEMVFAWFCGRAW
jgi:uncharacterized repeat protein (TIGR01451 family)